MGCSTSALAKSNTRKENLRRSNGVGGVMTKTEIDKRIESIPETCQATFGGVSVRYAYLSQRGYYPDDAHKPNQDSYVITQNFADRKSDVFFGVFDGHGRDGDKCAHFVRDNLSSLLSNAINVARQEEATSSIPLSKEKTHHAILKAHVECNKQMHSNEEFDDSLSGTTSISVLLQGYRNRITVSNVGDSRAVIGRSAITDKEKNGSESSALPLSKSSTLKAFALSRDQTPYRKDERIRCRKAGARILSLDQIEGLEPVDEADEELEDVSTKGEMVLGEEIDEAGDPPRVWSPHGDYPGTAFTRSIGDAIAEELGVHAEPEILTRELTSDDKIIVLASDGVFEFLTNQSVIDICAKFNDPLEACRAVVAESYELWLQYEMRTDDITMICIFIDDVDSSIPFSCSSSVASVSTLADLTEEITESERKADDELFCQSRPVRKNMSLEKSRALEKMKAKFHSIKDVTGEIEDDFDVETLYNEKSDEEKLRISDAIRASVMFQNITDAQRELIYLVMERMTVKKGQWIIKQGTVGDRFYIVDNGRFEVRILPEGQVDVNDDGGNIVHIYDGSTGNTHPSFGELALLYSAPRAASIIAQTDGQLWALHRCAFKKVVTDQNAKKNSERVLKSIDAFKSCSTDELKGLASYLCEAKYVNGDIIIKEGEYGDSIFIILPGGTCESVKTAADGTKSMSVTLSGDDFFGDEILKEERVIEYVSTVTASSKVTCWVLQKGDVKRVIGNLRKSNASAI